MKIITLLIIVGVVSVSLGLGLWVYGNATSEETNMNYGISMMTNKISYSVGEPITMTLKIFNYTEGEITFHFNTGQRYDFIIKDEEGSKIWRWSQDKMFAMVLGEVTLGSNSPEVTYTAEYKDKLSPGYCEVTGILVTKDRPMSGNIIIMVK